MKPPNRTSLRNRIGLRDLWKRKDRAFELRKQAQLGKRRGLVLIVNREPQWKSEIANPAALKHFRFGAIDDSTI